MCLRKLPCVLPFMLLYGVVTAQIIDPRQLELQLLADAGYFPAERVFDSTAGPQGALAVLAAVIATLGERYPDEADQFYYGEAGLAEPAYPPVKYSTLRAESHHLIATLVDAGVLDRTAQLQLEDAIEQRLFAHPYRVALAAAQWTAAGNLNFGGTLYAWADSLAPLFHSGKPCSQTLPLLLGGLPNLVHFDPPDSLPAGPMLDYLVDFLNRTFPGMRFTADGWGWQSDTLTPASVGGSFPVRKLVYWILDGEEILEFVVDATQDEAGREWVDSRQLVYEEPFLDLLAQIARNRRQTPQRVVYLDTEALGFALLAAAGIPLSAPGLLPPSSERGRMQGFWFLDLWQYAQVRDMQLPVVGGYDLPLLTSEAGGADR